MNKFEYKILTISTSHLCKKSFREELDAKFNRWGDEGWELVKMEPITSGGFIFHGANTNEFLVVFKKEK